MSTLDIILLVCFIPALIQGIRKGFIEQAVALVSLIAGAWLAFKFSSMVSIWLQPYLEVSETVLNVISFALVVLVTVFILFILGKLLSGAVKLVMLGWLDRLLGLVFALLLAALVLSLVIILFDTVNVKFELVKPEVFSQSVLYGPLKDFGYTIFPYLKELLFKQ